jgi:hypothetical protein
VAQRESSGSVRPAIRAIQSKNLLAAFDGAVPLSEATALYDRVGAETIEGIRSALMLSWVPLDQHMRLSVEVMELLGSERFVDLFQHAFERSLDSAMLRGLFGALRRLSAHSIHTFFRNGPRVYGHIVRDAGIARYERDAESTAVLVLTGWPTQFATECWALGTLGCLRAMLSAAHGAHGGKLHRTESPGHSDTSGGPL